MGRLGIVLGSNAAGPQGERVRAAAEAGAATVVERHGRGEYSLPHEIDHAANLGRLVDAGCDRVLAIGSVGSLRAEIPVGALVCPDDFIALHVGRTTLSGPEAHLPPGFDAAWRAAVIAAWRVAVAGELREGGIYWEAVGPRYETPAEIRLIAAHADLVGMTIASECTVARELGLAYAAVCCVDNLANGIGPAPISVEELDRDRARNAARVAAALAAVIPELADAA